MGGHRLGEFELLVLMAALRLGPDHAYAVGVVEDIAKRTGTVVRRANVYTALKRLESRGFITTRMGEPRAERGGKARRLIRVQPAGLDAVRASTRTITAMAQGLEDLLGDPA